MVAFARFVMRDNGLAIHINAEQVTQVRETTEGDPAIYTLGRETPMIVEGTFEAAIRKLEAAVSGIRALEPAPGAPIEHETQSGAEAPAPRTPVLELVVARPQGADVKPGATPEAEPAKIAKPVPAVAAEPTPSKAKSVKKDPVKKEAAKAKPAKAKPTKAAKAETPAKPAKAAKAEAPAKPAEPPYPTASWFMGNR